MANIYFLMGVSGSGKTTVLNHSQILDNDAYVYVQSYTTRPLRNGEIDGEKYNHVDPHTFQQDIEAGEFLEWATVHKDYMYGTKFADIVGPLDDNVNTIKEIEIFGLLDIMQQGKIDGLYKTIFLDIPEDIMIQRIRGRGDVSPDELQKRIQSAQFEREQAKKHCDAIIDASQSLEHVVEQFKSLVGVE